MSLTKPGQGLTAFGLAPLPLPAPPPAPDVAAAPATPAPEAPAAVPAAALFPAAEALLTCSPSSLQPAPPITTRSPMMESDAFMAANETRGSAAILSDCLPDSVEVRP